MPILGLPSAQAALLHHPCSRMQVSVLPFLPFLPSLPFPPLLLPSLPLTVTLWCPGKHGAAISLTPERVQRLIQHRAAFNQLQTTSPRMQPVLVVRMSLKGEQAGLQMALPARVKDSQPQQLPPKPQGPWMIYLGRSLICFLKSMTYSADDTLSTVVEQLGSLESGVHT